MSNRKPFHVSSTVAIGIFILLAVYVFWCLRHATPPANAQTPTDVSQAGNLLNLEAHQHLWMSEQVKPEAKFVPLKFEIYSDVAKDGKHIAACFDICLRCGVMRVIPCEGRTAMQGRVTNTQLLGGMW